MKDHDLSQASSKHYKRNNRSILDSFLQKKDCSLLVQNCKSSGPSLPSGGMGLIYLPRLKLDNFTKTKES